MSVNHHLLLGITLQPPSEKHKFLYLCRKQLSKRPFPKFESHRSHERKIPFFSFSWEFELK